MQKKLQQTAFYLWVMIFFTTFAALAAPYSRLIEN